MFNIILEIYLNNNDFIFFYFTHAVAILIFYYSVTNIFLFVSGIYAQRSKGRKKPETVTDLFNTTSCIPKPYRCPHKQIQFYLYTR